MQTYNDFLKYTNKIFIQPIDYQLFNLITGNRFLTRFLAEIEF
jgi:hypothetical protein